MLIMWSLIFTGVVIISLQKSGKYSVPCNHIANIIIYTTLGPPAAVNVRCFVVWTIDELYLDVPKRVKMIKYLTMLGHFYHFLLFTLHVKYTTEKSYGIFRKHNRNTRIWHSSVGANDNGLVSTATVALMWLSRIVLWTNTILNVPN